MNYLNTLHAFLNARAVFAQSVLNSNDNCTELNQQILNFFDEISESICIGVYNIYQANKDKEVTDEFNAVQSVINKHKEA